MSGQVEPEAELVRRFRAGDRAAFAVLIRRFGPALQRLSVAITREPALANDAVQETCLSAFRGAATFQPERGAFLPWLLAIGRREAYRLRSRVGSEELDLPGEGPSDEATLGGLGLRAGWSAEDPESVVARAEDRERLSWALASLPVSDREVVWLRDVEGLSGEETAAISGVELGAMKSRLHRARLRLMAALREGEGSVVEKERIAGGVSCSTVLSQLSDYVDGHLQPSAKAGIDAHLLGCTVCARFGGRFRHTVSNLRTRLGASASVDEDAYLSFLERFEPSNLT